MNDYRILTDLESRLYTITVSLTSNLSGFDANFEYKTKPIYTLPNVNQQDYIKVKYKEKKNINSFIDTIVVKTVHRSIYNFISSEIKAKRYKQISKNIILLDKGMYGRIVELHVPMHRKPKFEIISSNVTYSKPTDKYDIFMYQDDLESDGERHKTIEAHMNKYIRPNRINNN